jgi:hypothetical protein
LPTPGGYLSCPAAWVQERTTSAYLFLFFVAFLVVFFFVAFFAICSSPFMLISGVDSRALRDPQPVGDGL